MQTDRPLTIAILFCSQRSASTSVRLGKSSARVRIAANRREMRRECQRIRARICTTIRVDDRSELPSRCDARRKGDQHTQLHSRRGREHSAVRGAARRGDGEPRRAFRRRPTVGAQESQQPRASFCARFAVATIDAVCMRAHVCRLQFDS